MPIRKSLYSGTGSLNEQGFKLADVFEKHITAIYKELLDEGYQNREITHVLMSALTLVDSREALVYADRYDLEKRMEIAGQPIPPVKKKKERALG